MLDDLRNSAETGFFEEDPLDKDTFESEKKHRSGPFLGMTAPQRFILVFILFLMVAILGVFILIVFQKVYPPI
jgi:hypothetical protein